MEKKCEPTQQIELKKGDVISDLNVDDNVLEPCFFEVHSIEPDGFMMLKKISGKGYVEGATKGLYPFANSDKPWYKLLQPPTSIN